MIIHQIELQKIIFRMLRRLQKQLFFLILLISFIQTEHFNFKRSIYCVLQTAKGCVHWESALHFQKPSDPACFPQETYLQGTNGKIKISELKVGDQILVFNSDKGVSYEPVIAWLHRSTQQTFTYTSIQYELQNFQNPIQNRLLISGMHNIAVLDQTNQQLEFVFTQKLDIGNNLYGIGPYSKSGAPQIIEIIKENKQKGIYAPYTKSGNFFVTGDFNSQQLILVHCFAHVSSKYHLAFDIVLSAASLIFDVTSQPSDQQKYINPLANLLKNVFPSIIEINQMNKQYEKKMKQLHNSQFRTAGDKTVELDPLKSQRQVFLMIELIISRPSLLP